MELSNTYTHTYDDTCTHTPKKEKVERVLNKGGEKKKNERGGRVRKKEKTRKRTKRKKGKKEKIEGKERKVGGGAKGKKKRQGKGFRELEEPGY